MTMTQKITLIFWLCVCPFVLIACSTNDSEGKNLTQSTEVINFGEEIEVQTDNGNFTVSIVNVHEPDLQNDRDDVKIFSIQAEVYNESYSGTNDEGLTWIDLSDYLVLVDNEGYDLPFNDINGGNDGLYEIGATTKVSSKKRVSLPYYVPNDCDSVRVRVETTYTDEISLSNEDTTNVTDTKEETASDEMEDIDDIVSKIEKCTYKSVDTAKELIDEYYSEMTDEQKEASLLALAKCKAPSELETKIKNSLKSPRSFYLYECTVSDYVTYYEDDDRYDVTVKMKYGATNSYGAEITNSVTAFCYYTINLEYGTIDCVEISVFDF